MMGICGPLGTGKTETFKDFAHLCGIKISVYQCSDQTGVEELNHIHDFCDDTHTVCLDDFNRIRFPNLDEGDLKFAKLAVDTEDGKKRINNIPGYRIFITMNPGDPWRNRIPAYCPWEPIDPSMTIPPMSDIYHVKLAV